MVLDYRRFTRGQGLGAGGFFVLEQEPGVSHSEDMTEWLMQKGYWASYDRAFFDQVRAVTGDDAMEATEPRSRAALFSKDDTPRAQIFRRAVQGVGSLDGMRQEMTRNMGTQEPVDEQSFEAPRFAISARDDLLDNSGKPDPAGSPEGGIDAKVTSSCLFGS